MLNVKEREQVVRNEKKSAFWFKLFDLITQSIIPYLTVLVFTTQTKGKVCIKLLVSSHGDRTRPEKYNSS